MNGALCSDCNIIIIFFYLQCKTVGRESRQTVPNGGSWVPSLQTFMPRSLLANRLHDTWRDTPEQTGSSTWLGLSFTFHPTAFLPLLTTLSNPQPSAVSPQNSNLPVLPPLPLTSELAPEKNSLQVLPPLRTYSKLRSSSTHIETPLPIHKDGPSTSSPISVPNPTQATANIFYVEDTSLSLSLDSSTASDGEFGCFSGQNSSSKPTARRSLLKELNLAMSDLTPRKRKLYQRIWRKESALYKSRKKYRSRIYWTF